MSITREEAIKRHRLMWNWIAEESLKQKRGITKKEAFEHFGWHNIETLCWCCEYAKQNYSSFPFCLKCPVKWPNGCCVIDDTLFSEIGLYNKFNSLLLKEVDDTVIIMIHEVALQIAELPERV